MMSLKRRDFNMANNLFNGSKFSFIGTLGFGDTPLTTKQMGSSDWSKTKLGVSVRNGSNSQFLSMEYIHSDKVKTTKIITKAAILLLGGMMATS